MWNFVSRGHPPKSRYWYRLAVASRWPVIFEREVALPKGAGMSVIIETPQRSLRVLVVDGISDPRVLRSPMLRGVADHCRAEEAPGRAVDIVAGDFNAPATSIGFDGLRGAGFVLASTRSGGWRATYPALLPLYDLDHVWVAPGKSVRSCRFVFSSGSNHRGQVVELEVGATPASRRGEAASLP